jgi:hypothetical protein
VLRLEQFSDIQWEGLAHLHVHPFSALWFDAGIGKTGIGLTYLKQRLDMGVSRRALVVAPPYQLIRAEDDDPEVKQAYNDAYFRARTGELKDWEVDRYIELALKYQERSWIDYWTAGLSPVFPEPENMAEFERRVAVFARMARTDGLPPEEASRAAGTITTEIKDQIRRRQALSDAPLHFINREALGWLVDYHRERQKGFPYDDVIYDEASDLGDHNTQRFKAMKAIRPYLKSFVEMTATPAAEGYIKLFSQIALLDQGERWGLHVTHWREQHFNYNSRTYSYKLKKGHDKVISSQVADIALVAKAEDHLPKIATQWTDLTRKIELGPELRALEEEFIASRILRLTDTRDAEGIPDEFIDADTPASLSQKLLQFCSGAVYDKDKKTHLIHDHKIEELRQLMDELQGEPIMLVYWWKSSLARLRKAFPKMKVMDQQGSQQDDWNRGKINMLALHPQGSEFGLNLQKGPGHDIVIFDLFWSYEKWYQIHKRLARQGQTRPVRSWPLVVRGSADEVAVKRLQAKEDAQNALFRYIQKMRDKYQGVEDERQATASYASAFD